MLGEKFLAKRIDQENFIVFKSCQLIFLIDIIFIVLMLTLVFFTFVKGNLNKGFYLLPLVILATVVSLIYAIKGKNNLAANVLGISSCLLASLGFFFKPIASAGITQGYFIFLDLIFVALFCQKYISLSVVGVFTVSQVAKFFLQVRPETDPLLKQIGSETFFEGTVIMFIIFFIAIFTKDFLNEALEKSAVESKKNLDNFKQIEELMNTIHDVTQNVEHTIQINNEVVEGLATSSQVQAATAEELSSTIEEISAGIENVTDEANNQNDLMTELHEILFALSNSVDLVDEANAQLDQLFSGFMDEAKQGQEASGQLSIMGNQISENSEQMKMVTAVIEDFFDRINLLSLNASIEAARAGEHGRGFAVVADEIGKLADSSAQELKQITTLIQKNQDDVNHGKKSISQIVQFLEELLTKFNKILAKSQSSLLEVDKQKEMKDKMKKQADLVMEKASFISTAMNEQNVAVNDIVQSVEQTNNIIQETAENTETLHQNAKELKALIENLKAYFQ